ncbi:flagellar basal body-associated FliL family protein [Paenibacillus thermotolerans]|uniref:flagellar basal body-associated FliL family protein n=1 Tax=Paenibacillus thermotolerans TaxID=3027807 RepID=UPI002367FFAA|nr:MULTISPECIES: flagellar basal body-associated FliL family protein [unclassified Paenibacillus]
MLPWLIVILLAVTLIVGAAFVLWNQFQRESTPQDPREAAKESANMAEAEYVSAEKLKDMTFAIDDVIANLSDQSYFVNASFTFELDSKEAKTEFEMIQFKVKDVINTTLSDLKPEQVKGSAGIDNMSSVLINRTNELLHKGKVRHVYVTKLIVTEQ